MPQPESLKGIISYNASKGYTIGWEIGATIEKKAKEFYEIIRIMIFGK